MKQFYLIFFLLVSVTESFAQTLEDDRLALVALYNATDGNNWVNKIGWNPTGAPGDNPCGWFGVTCSGNRVTELNLQNNDLTGSLPNNIGNLSALVSLNLKGNDPLSLQGMYIGMHGVIPAQIGSLMNLEYLDLGGNSFSGSIPSTIGNLVKLTYLNINYVPFDAGFNPVGVLGGTIPIELGNLTNLKYLDLSDQNLSGNLLSELGNLTSLEYLKLGGNIFEGTIPVSFTSFTNLKVLDLHYVRDGVRGYNSYGALHGPIPDLSGIPASANVILSDNSFNFSGMEANISRLDSYSPQAKLPLNIMYDTFPLPYIISVDAGGLETGYPTFSNNNTYRFFKDGVLIATQIGDDHRFIDGGGMFRIEVINSIVPGLILYSEEVFIEQGTMPVTLVSFKGANEQNGNILTWKTTSETNNKGFQIERSVDAKTFENIGFVDGMGDNLGDKIYTFLDAKPYFNTYYRLKQLDWDGKSEYSRIITVKQDKTKLSVYPNPAKNEFFVSGLDREEAVEIRNAAGRIVLEQKVNPAQPVRTDKLLNGLYLIKVGEETRKIVIQN